MTKATTSNLATRLIPADADGAAAAADCLRGGGLVAFPTETVYGLGADAGNPAAVARLYQAKGRPSFNPLIVHVADLAAARRFGRFDAAALRLAQAFWPGPLTLVLPKAEDCEVCDLATAGLDSVALRVPNHAFAQDLLRAFGGGIVAPSANRSGHVSPTTAAHVLDDLDGRIDLIVDGGAVAVGVESTIVACLDQPTLLRPGGLARDAIEAVLTRPLHAHEPGADSSRPRAPGLLASHYAPRARIRLGATAIEPGEAALLFGPRPPAGLDVAGAVLNLSLSGDPNEAAANLFSHLRRLDASGASRIAVMPIPDDGLGEAINDRLRRAAAPRP